MACQENSDTVADQSVMYVHSLANWQNQLKRAERQVRLMESLLEDLYTRLDRAEHLKKPHFVDALKLRIDTVESMLQMYDLFVEYKAAQLLSLAAVAGACAELSEEAVWAGTNNTPWRVYWMDRIWCLIVSTKRPFSGPPNVSKAQTHIL